MNKTIIITNNFKFLKKCLGNREMSISYLVLEESRDAGLIKKFFSARSNANEVVKKRIITGDDFTKEYSRFIYRLNAKNACKGWWSMNFTSKNPLLSKLYDNLYNTILVKRLVEKDQYENLVVISSSRTLEKYIKYWTGKTGVRVKASIFIKTGFKNIAYYIPAFFIFYAFARTVLRKILSRLLLSVTGWQVNKDYIIITQFENSSFEKNGGFYDVYFGRLKEFLKKGKNNVLTCGYTACAFKNIIKKAPAMRGDLIFPLEYFMTFGDIVMCLRDSLWGYFKRHDWLKGSAEISGEDVAWLIRNEIDFAFASGQVLVNLAVYYAVKGLLGIARTKKILYPFENRSWEKMILLAAQESTLGVKTVGYQHASLTPKHINFIFEKDEASSCPLPDEIITMGSITKKIMIERFNFPEDKVRVGCALRINLPQPSSLPERFFPATARVSVVLASNIDEYVKTLKFLDCAFSQSQLCALSIRPHPAISFKNALNIYKPENIQYELDKQPLAQSLKGSTIVIYVSSSVSLEAVSLGIPVICIDLDDILSPDPMFGMPFLKWECAEAKQLNQTIKDIFDIEDTVFLTMQKKAREFAESYCVASTDEALEVFK